jgi:hypothetical protein
LLIDRHRDVTRCYTPRSRIHHNHVVARDEMMSWKDSLIRALLYILPPPYQLRPYLHTSLPSRVESTSLISSTALRAKAKDRHYRTSPADDVPLVRSARALGGSPSYRKSASLACFCQRRPSNRKRAVRLRVYYFSCPARAVSRFLPTRLATVTIATTDSQQVSASVCDQLQG